MFNATISGVVKRVLFDNEKDAEKAFIKVVVECRKQFAKKDDLPYTYPVVAIFGHDAAYFRDYGGKGHYVELTGCDYDVYRGEDGDEDEKISFKAGKLALLPKQLSDQLEIEDEDDDEDDKKKAKKKKARSSRDEKPARGKSRSERRSKARDDEDEEEDEDDEDEEEAPPRRKKKPAAKPAAKKKTSSKPASKKRREEEEDEDYDDDDDDDFYDDEDED